MLEAQGIKRIDTRQMVLLLFVCRVFTLMAYVPQGQGTAGGSVVMLGAPLAAVLGLLLLLPAYLLLRHWGGRDLLDCAYRQSKWLGNASAGLAWLFCIIQLISSLSSQNLFLTSTIYHHASSRTILIILCLAAFYLASLGLESFSRLSLGICIGYLLLLIMVTVAVAPHIDLIHLHNPLEEGVVPVLGAAVRAVSVNGELGAIVLLAPVVRGEMRRPCVVLNLLWAAVIAAIAFLTLTTLGDFAATQMFPVYTLSTVAEFFFFERMDAFHMAAWAFMGLIKIALYLYLAARCMAYLVGGKSKWVLGINALMATVVTVAAGGELSVRMASLNTLIYPMLLVTVVIPLLIGCSTRWLRKGKTYET